MKQKSDPLAGTAKSQLSMLITGDVNFGESYQAIEEMRGNGNILKSHGYEHTVEKLSALLRQCDFVISNLETTLPNKRVSPFAEGKDFIHWSDSEETLRQLAAHNIKSVSLANDHSIDFGDTGMMQTLEALEGAGVQTIGAGRTLAEARKPLDYEIALESAAGANRQRKIRIFSAFAVHEMYRSKFKAYAGATRPGTNPLYVGNLVDQIAALKQSEPDTFIIALLHWRRDYKWRSKAQLAVAYALMEAGADLLTGHGAHMLQEIEKIDDRWVCHGLGNFVFNSPGWYEANQVRPFSAVCRLIFSSDSSSPRCLLYPLFTNNRETRYQPRFVDETEFKEVIQLLRERTNDRAGFDREIGTGKDEFGRFIDMPLGQGTKPRTSAVAAGLSAGKRRVLLRSTITHAFKGPNILAPAPAVRSEVTVENPEALQPDAMARAALRLVRLLPELENALPAHRDDVKWVSDAVLNRLRLGEIAAVVAFTLMRRADEWIAPVTSGLLEDKSGFYLVCEYRRFASNARAATALAVELLRSAFRPVFSRQLCQREIAHFERKGGWSGELSTAYLCEQAERRRIPVHASLPGPALFGQGYLQKRMRETLTSSTGVLGMRMAQRKTQTVDILRQAGVPVPEQISVTNKGDAVEAAKRIGYPVVVKPIDGNQGSGVSVKLMSEEAVAAAFDEAVPFAERVIVESYIEGNDHRLLVINGEFVAACQRIPGHIVGNGADTVERLLQILNADPRRNGDLMYQLEYDFDARRMLEEQGLTLESVPAAGQVVVLRSKANTSVGGTSKGITERVHPDNRRLAVAAARALQLDVAGIDLITTDITRSYKETRGGVCEVNCRPGILDLHAFPLEGSSVAVGPYIMDMLFPPPSIGRIPVIAIYGDTPDRRLSHSIAQVLQIAGHEVALATQEGLWIGGDRIANTDSANFAGAQKAVLHPAATAAVIEIRTESMLSEGLGFDFSDVAVITQSLPSAAMSLIESIAGSLIHAGDAATREGDSERKKIRLMSSENATAQPPTGHIELAAAACRAVGVSQDSVEDALKASRDADLSDPLMLRGLTTSNGRVLLGTPRNSQEVDALLKAARSWSAPHAPDVIVHMSFEGDPDLQAALERELKSGTARALDRDLTNDLRFDVTPLVFTGGKRKVIILTDGTDYFKKRLEHVSANPFAHASFAGRPRTC